MSEKHFSKQDVVNMCGVGMQSGHRLGVRKGGGNERKLFQMKGEISTAVPQEERTQRLLVHVVDTGLSFYH